MHVVKKFYVNYKDISKFCWNKNIVAFYCEYNRPVEPDCAVIVLEDGTEIRIYSFFRVLDENEIVFSISDYWVDNNISDSILFVQEQLKGAKIIKIKFNRIGDCVFLLDNGKKIQIFIDATKDDPDYMIINKDKEYYWLSRVENELVTMVGDE